MPLDPDDRPQSGSRYLFATRLNSFRSSETRSLVDLIEKVSKIEGLSAIEVNYPQHLQTTSAAAFLKAVSETGLAVTAISLRYDDPEFKQGVFTSPNPETRQRAIRTTRDAIDLAARTGAPHVNVWMSH